MKNLNKVELLPYDPHWPALFQQEATALKAVLGDHLKEIYHMGSTAIPNMPAKPIIDIMLVCRDLDAIEIIAEKLKTLNYLNLHRQIIPYKSFFISRQDNQLAFHLHLYEQGNPQIKRHILFQDYLIHHPEVAKAYATLKSQLADQFSHDRKNYVLGKDKFVQAIDAKAKLWSVKNTAFLGEDTSLLANQWSHDKMVKAMIANLNVHMTHFAQYLNQVDLIRIPGFTIVNSGLPDDTFNYVLDADFSSAEANKKINEVTTYFTERQTPFSWWLSPLDKPDNLAEKLEQNGFQNTENNTAMYLDLDAWDDDTPCPPELEIVRARDEKTLQDFALILTNDKAAFKEYFAWIASVLTDDDPIEYYVGYVNGVPIVRGLSCYFAQVVGLHWLSTTPEQRKKGYGAAMQRYRLKRAKELGYHIAVLQASSEGYSLYRRLGYKECGVFREFKLIG